MSVPDRRAGRRYATALFETARKLNSVEAVQSELGELAQLQRKAPNFTAMWESPLVTAGQKKELLSTLFKDSVSPLTLEFLNLLVDKRRESILSLVHLELQKMADEAAKLVRVEATFAVSPNEEEKQKLTQSLKQRTGQDVIMTVNVDPTILGGVMLRMQDTIIDGSVRGTLERLREIMLQEA